MCATFKFPDFSITNLLMYLKKGVVNLFDLNLYAIVLYGSGFTLERTHEILKSAVNNSSMKMIDFLMDQLILPLVPFASENCCHLSLLSTLFHAEVSDKLNRQLADYPCKIIGSAVSDTALLFVCQSKKDAFIFLKKYIASLVEESNDLQSFFIRQVTNTLDPTMEKTSYKVTLHCTLDTAQMIEDTVNTVLHGKDTYCPLQLFAMNFYGEDSFRQVENLVQSDVIHSCKVKNDTVFLDGYTIQNPYMNQASDHTFFANLLNDTTCIKSMKFVDQFYE